MARPFKYPQILELKIGESFYLPKNEIENMSTLRVIVSRMGRSRGLVLSLHDDWRKDYVEIARLSPRTATQGITGATTPRAVSHKEMRAEIDRIHAELNANTPDTSKMTRAEMYAELERLEALRED